MLPEFRNKNIEDFYNLMDNFFNEPQHSSFKLDVKKKDNAYEVIAEVSGVNKENINIDVENENLIISVKSSSDETNEDKNKRYIRREIRSFDAKRSIYLPGIDGSLVDAKLEDGLLKINVPLREETKKRQIEIK
ncbi:MAG: Hsp20 family protein [Peptoniphilaceae bacterium]|nr:Hsp20 family protein [Peptoniphilaceae bacterium]MDD7383292.1 Hsp20 family protein [Peptoniphilaceae bacterium]MDY3738337.1 Hsp20 family protein [Peptoniphilaceae bacterium]